MTFKIDKNIPMPKVLTRRVESGEYRDTFAAMEVGDSFWVEIPKGQSEHGRRSNVWNHAKKAGVKISMAKEKNGFRVWLREKSNHE